MTTATFEFSAANFCMLGKYHKNTMCKVLADLKKFL